VKICGDQKSSFFNFSLPRFIRVKVFFFPVSNIKIKHMKKQIEETYFRALLTAVSEEDKKCGILREPPSRDDEALRCHRLAHSHFKVKSVWCVCVCMHTLVYQVLACS